VCAALSRKEEKLRLSKIGKKLAAKAAAEIHVTASASAT
jgi:hypothetical protein